MCQVYFLRLLLICKGVQCTINFGQQWPLHLAAFLLSKWYGVEDGLVAGAQSLSCTLIHFEFTVHVFFYSLYMYTVTLNPFKMCRQPATWLPTTRYLPLTSCLSDLYSGRRPFQLWPLLPIAIASLPTTQKNFNWAELLGLLNYEQGICLLILVLFLLLVSLG